MKTNQPTYVMRAFFITILFAINIQAQQGGATQPRLDAIPLTSSLPALTRAPASVPSEVEPRNTVQAAVDVADPNPSLSLVSSETTERIKYAPYSAMLRVPEYIEPIFIPVDRIRSPDLEWPWTRDIRDSASAQGAQAEEQQKQQSNPKWQYGGFVDLAYLLDFNHPSNHLFRSRGTAFRVDRVWLNIAAAYVRKRPSEQSRWGVELTVQAGKDDEFFGFSATAPNIAGFKFLRHLGPTNVSYLAPVGKGLTVQAGIFSSLIGYDSLYSKDNLNYTRPWGADFTPYFMMGANASYPFTDKLTGTFFVVNGYWHLARANSAPSAGGQIAYKLTPRWTLKETTLFGPHQRNTSFQFWRFLTDTIVERKTDKLTAAFEYIYSTERVDDTGKPRALMMSWQLPARWNLNDRWSVAVRPEVFWDRDGRWTLARQTVKAFTTTLEYRVPFRWNTTIFRLEHRWDDSRGPEGGFFRGREVSPGVVGLTPSQHLLIFATIFTFDSPAPR